MDIRRLVKAGQASHTISLPKTWLTKNNLKRGDPLFVREISDNELVISSKEPNITQKSKLKECTLNLDTLDLDSFQRSLTSAYINNYNQIHIIGKSVNEHAGAIRTLVHDFVALEIAEQTSSKIIAKDLLNLQEISVEQTIKRMDMILRSMLSDAKTVLAGKNVYDSIHFRDQDINRLYFLVYKLLKEALDNKHTAAKFNLTNTQILSTWYLSVNIENLADCQKQICKIFETITTKKEELKEILNQIETTYLDVMRSYYKQDHKEADKVAKGRINIINLCNAYIEKNKSIQAVELITSFKEMINLICNIARIVLDEDHAKNN